MGGVGSDVLFKGAHPAADAGRRALFDDPFSAFLDERWSERLGDRERPARIRRDRVRLRAAVDTIGLPIRIHPTPGQQGASPQAKVLLAGLKGVGHVIADAVTDRVATASISALAPRPFTRPDSRHRRAGRPR